MKKQFIAVTLGALVFVGAVGGLVFNKYQKSTNTNTASSAEMASSGHDAAMLGLLKAQTGDAYDTMFITMMSEHHAGAVVMAQMVDAQAPHAEVKALAVQIIAAQTKELADMKAWAAQWGYTYSEPSRSAVMAMSHGMDGLQGEALERQFLNDMIGHHNGALDMATLSASRANHAEIKSLSVNIEATQTKEIATMQQLLTQFGYSKSSTHEDHDSTMMH